jgi:hypothetical protein
MDRLTDEASFGNCRQCGDEITLKNVTDDEVLAKKRAVITNGGKCDRCEEGSTAFDKQARFEILQWLGPIEMRAKVASVVEPQNASYAVVTLKDGRSAKIFRRGESSRELPEEINHVFTRSFPDLKSIEKPWEV